MKIAFLGLGVMGYPMAGHLAQAGHEVTVYNRNIEKAHAWFHDNPQGQTASSVGQAVTHAELIITCIRKDDDLREIAYGEGGVLANMPPNGVWVDHTTASAEVARELYHACQAVSCDFIDAPVSGGQAGAEKGLLTIMVGGDEAVFERVRSTLDVYAKQITRVGVSGSGQLTKMVNQICLAGLIQGLSEAMNFAKAANLDSEQVIAAIQHGAAQSWQMDNRAKTMAEGQFDFGFAVDLMRKDLGLCLKEANVVGASLPVTALVDQFYGDLQTQGDGRLDTSSLIKRLVDA